MSNATEAMSPSPRSRWATLAATLRGVALLAVLGGVAGFAVARFVWM